MGKPSIPEVQGRFADYKRATENPQHPCHGEWGALHIVLADGNVKHADVCYCLGYATARGDTEGAELAQILLAMSPTQRKKLGSMKL